VPDSAFLRPVSFRGPGKPMSNSHRKKPDERIADAAENIAASIKDLAKFIKEFLVPQARGFDIKQVDDAPNHDKEHKAK